MAGFWHFAKQLDLQLESQISDFRYSSEDTSRVFFRKGPMACAKCNDDWTITCEKCAGQGWVLRSGFPDVHDKRLPHCDKCSGRGEVRCPQIGAPPGSQTKTNLAPGKIETNTSAIIHSGPCRRCDENKTINCKRCNGVGSEQRFIFFTVPCRLGCKNGKFACPACLGTGSVSK